MFSVYCHKSRRTKSGAISRFLYMSIALFEGSQAWPTCPSDEGVLRLRWVLVICGMTMTGKNRSNMRNTCPSATSSTIISHGVAWDRTRPSAVRVWRLTAWPMARSWSAKFRYVICNNPVPASKGTHFVSLKKSSWLMLNRNNRCCYMNRTKTTNTPCR